MAWLVWLEITHQRCAKGTYIIIMEGAMGGKWEYFKIHFKENPLFNKHPVYSLFLRSKFIQRVRQTSRLYNKLLIPRKSLIVLCPPPLPLPPTKSFPSPRSFCPSVYHWYARIINLLYPLKEGIVLGKGGGWTRGKGYVWVNENYF